MLLIRQIIGLLFILQLTRIECQRQRDQKCYGEYGCYEKAQLSLSSKLANAVGHYPDSPEKINVKFHAFSCKDRFNPTILRYNATENEMRRINYDPKKRTIFVIHGFLDNYDQFNWMGDVKDLILRLKPCTMNVIVVDWRGGTKQINYLQASANTRLVGAIIARFIEKLNNVYNTNNDHYTVMGHSLGGQICGFTGKHMKQQKLRLIIALDPAGPAFNDVSEQNRLNPSDAKLVLSIHTNGGVNVLDGFGTLKPAGHYNFFPNGGETQPGCQPIQGITAPLNKGFYEGIQDTVACSHLFVYRLIEYDEERDDDFESMAYACQDYKAYEAGRCGTCRDNSEDCKPFGRWYGWWQDQKLSPNWERPIVYYIDTKKEEPYSYFFYQIKIRTGNDFRTVNARLYLNVSGSLRSDFNEEVFIDRRFEPNKEYTHLLKLKKTIGRVEAVDATFTNRILPNEAATTISKVVSVIPGASGMVERQRMTVNEIQFNYMNGYNESFRKSMSSVLRDRNGPVEITGKDVTRFTATNTGKNNNRRNNNNRGNSNDRETTDNFNNNNNSNNRRNNNRGNSNDRDTSDNTNNNNRRNNNRGNSSDRETSDNFNDNNNNRNNNRNRETQSNSNRNRNRN